MTKMCIYCLERKSKPMGQEGDRGGERTTDGTGTRGGGRKWYQLHFVRNGLKQETIYALRHKVRTNRTLTRRGKEMRYI